MNPSPLPQPAARTCSNCGAAVNESAALCPNCGATLVKSQNGCLIVAAQIFLGLLTLIFGLGGACVVLISSVEGGIFSNGNFGFASMGFLAVAFAAACIWGIIRLGKRRK